MVITTALPHANNNNKNKHHNKMKQFQSHHDPNTVVMSTTTRKRSHSNAKFAVNTNHFNYSMEEQGEAIETTGFLWMTLSPTLSKSKNAKYATTFNEPQEITYYIGMENTDETPLQIPLTSGGQYIIYDPRIEVHYQKPNLVDPSLVDEVMYFTNPMSITIDPQEGSIDISELHIRDYYIPPFANKKKTKRKVVQWNSFEFAFKKVFRWGLGLAGSRQGIIPQNQGKPIVCQPQMHNGEWFAKAAGHTQLTLQETRIPDELAPITEETSIEIVGDEPATVTGSELVQEKV